MAGGAQVLGLLFQFEDTQWLPPSELEALQLRQLDALLRHAWETVPFYREHWRGAYDPAAPLTAERFRALPLLTRRDVQERFEALQSERAPREHGAIAESNTSGSIGTPLRVRKTALCGLLWKAFVLRDHLWHGRDLGAKLAAIRAGPARGSETRGWGVATDDLVETGRAATLGVRASVDEQLDWLRARSPAYLLTYPSLAVALVEAAHERGLPLPPLRELRTMGELLTAEQRAYLSREWMVPVTDAYSAEEFGYIALQCPQGERYHVQAESLRVEILDEDSAPCPPGATGRVAITDLHNFAMPLVRYDIADYAEPGEPCACGRGLPVLRRVVGRARNMLVTADGARYWPLLGSRKFLDIAPVRQHQLVQKEFDLIEVRLVTAQPLSAEQEARLGELILAGLPAGIRLRFSHCERIERSAGGKFEDFVCEVATGAAR